MQNKSFTIDRRYALNYFWCLAVKKTGKRQRMNLKKKKDAKKKKNEKETQESVEEKMGRT